MSRVIHVNFLSKAEQRSAAPVRMRVIAPLAAGFLAGAFVVGAVVLRGVLNSTHAAELALSIDEDRLITPFEESEEVERRAKSVEAGLQQLGFYRAARITWGRTLETLPDVIPETAQLRELRLAYPTLPQAMPTTRLPAPTNRVETARMTFSGRTIDSDSVETILQALRSARFEDRFERVEIPPGAFRPEDRRTGSDGAALLFELRAFCHPRRFE